MIEVSIVRFIKILRQDLSNIFHNPTLIFSNTILPLVLIGVLGFITKSGFGDTPVNSFDYYFFSRYDCYYSDKCVYGRANKKREF